MSFTLEPDQEVDPITRQATVTLTWTPAPLPVGITAYVGGGVRDEDEYARIEGLVGQLAVRRTFSGLFPETWELHPARHDLALGVKLSVVSVKSDIMRMAEGRDDALVAGFVRSIPARHRVVLIWQHEPENPSKRIDPGAYRLGAARFASVVHATTRPDQDIRVGWCLMGYSFTPASGRNPDDWWPGSEAVDIVCPDPYSFTTTRPAKFTDPDVGAIQSYVYSVLRQKPYAVAEWGCYDLPEVDRVAFIHSGDLFLRAVGAEFAAWFHNGKCRLDLTPESLAAFTAHVSPEQEEVTSWP